MGLIDKDKNFTNFDKLIRTNQGEALLAHIFSTYWEWFIDEASKLREKDIDDNENKKIRKMRIKHRLKPLYDIFKGNAGSYGEDPEKIDRQYDSQYTIGNDMGIWIDSDLNLSHYAIQVAESRITVREYISRVFLNLFTYVNGEYTHILYKICEYADSKSLDNIVPEDIIKAIIGSYGESVDSSIREQANIIFNYLLATDFFILGKGDRPYLVFVQGCSASKLKSLCNLKYRDIDGEKVRGDFKDKKKYAEYVGQPILYKDTCINEESEEENYTFETKDEDIDITEIESERRQDNIQKLIYGPPGTGKSYSITSEVQKSYSEFNLEDENPFVFRTTFHPEYTYHDFIGQVMPIVKNNSITYDFSPGIFTQALKKAIDYWDHDIYLILEEMSRANVAAIFGDVFQLLDRKEGISEYKINHDMISSAIYGKKQKIYLPDNFHIIGTVNTSDQNVYVMDTAFKRRFDLDYMDLTPVLDGKGEVLNDYPMVFENSKNERYESSWIKFYQNFNEFIISIMKLSEDKQLGQFFIKFTENSQKNKQSIYGKLLQYIWQDVHSIAFSDKSLFRKDINSFSKAYGELKSSLEKDQTITIFSDEFLKTLDFSRSDQGHDIS